MCINACTDVFDTHRSELRLPRNCEEMYRRERLDYGPGRIGACKTEPPKWMNNVALVHYTQRQLGGAVADKLEHVAINAKPCRLTATHE